ncbi:MAG: ATP-dependent DNA helicase [bacterium]
MDFEKRYKELNKQQKKAVDMIEGPLLVIAGPGSGKTEILSLRVGKILQKSQVNASNILCLTFTEAASINMRNRLTKLIGQEGYRVAIHTFHNFCVEIIQKYPEYFYSGAYFSTANELTQIQILEEIFEKLPHKNPLSSTHPEQGFVFLKDSLKLIGNLKKAGIEPEEFKKILEHNKKFLPEINEIIQNIFSAKLSEKTIKKTFLGLNKLQKLSEKIEKDFPTLFFKNLAETTYESLKKSVEEAELIDKTSPLKDWKNKNLKKDNDNKDVLKDTFHMEKLFAFSEIYTDYKKNMFEKGYYDFDDMILDCINLLGKNPSLRYEIQEQYQYILVDEFQDTNKAQMKLINFITDAPVNEGKPNIMAVGDCDQAIYKFQGAEIENFSNFKKIFKDVQEISMMHNYRSTQDIVDIAEEIILKGEKKLEKISSKLEKKLISSNSNIKNGIIKHKEFFSDLYEYHFIAKEIKRKIDEGENPEEIVIIARKHNQLQFLVPFLQNLNISIRYEREQNVFKEPHLSQIIIISKFLASLMDKHKNEADELLPEILSFPFWKIKKEDVWKISLFAKRNDFEKNWLEVMLESDNKKISNIAKFLIELGVRAQNEPLEKILDLIVGSHLIFSKENEDDRDADKHGYKTQINANKNTTQFISPFKEFYFNKEKFDHSKAEYLSFLSSLRVFVNALREYKSGEILSIKNLVEFVELYEKNNISLNDQSPFSKLKGAVNLMTAHGAKGLEFETVFVLSCQDDIWASKGINSKIVAPTNLSICPDSDNENDKLRLFYVAITRAKTHLYLTSHQIKGDGKETKKLRFLVFEKDEKEIKKEVLKKLYFPEQADKNGDAPEPHEVLTASHLNYRTTSFIGTEKKILETLLDEYKMSITHLNNFLNIEKGGPQYFLEQNLLRFPQSKINSNSYGTAIHKTLEKFVSFLKKEKKLADRKDVLEWFLFFLKKERMSLEDFEKYSIRGCEALEKFLDEKQNTFNQKDIIEFNFKEQNVFVNGAKLNGKIDRIVFAKNNELEVYDYKTGKAPRNGWDGKDENEKRKLYEYEKQLIFYKILVENSREFGGKKKVNKGFLEFIEPRKTDGKIIVLDLIITKEKTEKLKQLINAVYKKIMNLNFPDISKYSKDLKGIKEFEKDLLNQKL